MLANFYSFPQLWQALKATTKRAYPTVRSYTVYGAMVAGAVLLVTWQPVLALKVWVVSTVALYAVFNTAFNAVVAVEIALQTAQTAALDQLRQGLIQSLQGGAHTQEPPVFIVGERGGPDN
jgi:RsiW-degrading membrane proteinase PrsW (M82 family)